MKNIMMALVAVLAIAGCTKNTAGLRVEGDTQNVLFGDNVLGGRLIIDNIATTDVDGHARGVVTLTSQYKGDQNIQYRYYWYDNDGLEVNSKLAAWKQTLVRGFETVTISEVSVNPNGKQFRVQIRQAD
ncbi:YcfL family protein [Vibrio sp. JC009]|uniref:YcfL family protein n=1 Tax=Vibrio sp. JC009 TaxID=2912314 RepID=UPI0023B1B6FF|nr:YcfL family protein [Vibrio sp. JC009]WED23302.1 YcfL family protein [Vibrio sp. JC009]